MVKLASAPVVWLASAAPLVKLVTSAALKARLTSSAPLVKLVASPAPAS
jgi:hypothetical protein